MTKYKTVFIIVFFALVIRLLIAYFSPPTWDTQATYINAQLLKQGGFVYNETSRFTNPPTWLWMIGALSILSEKTSLPLSFLAKIPFIISDLGIGLIILKLVIKMAKNKSWGNIATALYLFNPLTILVSSYLGQIDSLFLLLVIISGWFLTRNKKITLTDIFVSGLFLGLAATIKLVPLGLVPVFVYHISKRNSAKRISDKRNVFVPITIFLTITSLPLALEFLPYLPIWQSFYQNVFGYQAHWGLWGISLLLRGLSQIPNPNFHQWLSPALHVSQSQNLSVLILFVFSYLTIYVKKFPFWQSILFVFLTTLVLSSNISPHYLLWVIPFFIITVKPKEIFLFLVFSFATSFGIIALFSFWFGSLSQNLMALTIISYAVFMLIAWLITIKWWLSMLKETDFKSL